MFSIFSMLDPTDRAMIVEILTQTYSLFSYPEWQDSTICVALQLWSLDVDKQWRSLDVVSEGSILDKFQNMGMVSGPFSTSRFQTLSILALWYLDIWVCVLSGL